MSSILVTPMIQSVIANFGEMGSRWGINRTVGQIYALLVLTEEPINADQISEALGISRSNVSMSLKELQSWRLVRLQHIPGDRKEYFTAPKDMWEIARTLIEERRKREMDPTLSVMREVLMSQPANEQEEFAQQKVQEMYELMEKMAEWSKELQNLNSDSLKTLMSLGVGVGKVIELKDRLVGKK